MPVPVAVTAAANPGFWAGAGGAAIAGGGALLGGLMGQASSKDAAKNQRRFITKQMQNAHQWEVEDLRKAGLNPILSAGGSGARGGTMASPQFNDVVGPAVNSAIAAKQANTMLQQQRAQITNIESDTRLKRIQGSFTAAQKMNTDVDTTWKQLNAAITALKIPQEQTNSKFYETIGKMDMKPLLSTFGITGASDSAQAAFRGLLFKLLGR